MHIATALRRKRDEIAATIAACEARIDAARMDLAALERAARLFDAEAGRDETVTSWDLDRFKKPAERLEAHRDASEKQRALATGRLTPPVGRTQALERQLMGKVAPLDMGRAGRDRRRFFSFGLAVAH
jgi:hypothetical protein